MEEIYEIRMSRKKNRKMRIKEVLILYHSLDIEKRELLNIQVKLDYIQFVREQLVRLGLNTENVDKLIEHIQREHSYSRQTIQQLNSLIPEKVDKKALQESVKQFLLIEHMSYHELSREIGIPYTEFEMFIRTGNADDYLTMRLFEYFQSNN